MRATYTVIFINYLIGASWLRCSRFIFHLL